MLNTVESVAIPSATFFCGAAVYINVAEHPAPIGCDTKTAATVWAPSYKRATLMQASLAILGGGIGAASRRLALASTTESQIASRAEALAEPRFPAPSFSVYEDRMHPWVVLPANIEHMA